MAVVIAAALGAACAPEAAEDPTWVADVRPILVANCIRCHGDIPASDAPSTFRLDILEDTENSAVKGAQSMAEFIAARAAQRGDMPPEGPGLSSRQKQVLDAWRFTVKAGRREANLQPEVSMTHVAGDPEAATVELFVTDGDGDIVNGELKVDGAVVAPVRDGIQRITVDTRSLAAGTRALTAILDDGDGKISVDLGGIEVVHDNAVPMVTLPRVRSDDLVVAGEPARVSLRADDADGDAVTVNLDAVLGDTRVRLLEDVVPELSGLVEIEVATGELSEGDGWRYEATISDGKSERTVTSAPFIVSRRTSAETYQSLRALIDDQCARCHSKHLPTGPDFSVLADLQEVRGRAWRKVITRQMPPPSVSVVYPELSPLGDADRARLVEWFYAGAPP